MAVFHLVWDLEFFGFLPPGISVSPFWRTVSILVAGSFLFLAGVSLHLAHQRGFRTRPFLARLAKLIAAAAVISLVTSVMMPDAFVYFGILHSIAVASVLALPFLRLPWAATLAAAAGVLILPHVFRTPLLDGRALAWTGLGTWAPPSMDFEPVFPWFGATLLGVAAISWAASAGLLPRLARINSPRALGWAGRHSLIIYLLHQPVLYGLVWAAALLLR